MFWRLGRKVAGTLDLWASKLGPSAGPLWQGLPISNPRGTRGTLVCGRAIDLSVGLLRSHPSTARTDTGYLQISISIADSFRTVGTVVASASPIPKYWLSHHHGQVEPSHREIASVGRRKHARLQ